MKATGAPARLLSVNVGLPRDVEWQGRTIHTGIWKEPVAGRTRVRRLNIDGDGQGDLAGHGGEHRAVFVYQIESYRYWEEQLGRHDFTYGQFGENFTVEGLADDEVCIGDRYRIRDVVFEVTQPRVTCYRVGVRLDEPELPALLVAHHRPGFYFRVLQEGEVQAGDEITKLDDRPRGHDRGRDGRVALPAAASGSQPRSGPAHPGALSKVGASRSRPCSTRTRVRGTRASTRRRDRPRPGPGSAPSAWPASTRSRRA